MDHLSPDTVSTRMTGQLDIFVSSSGIRQVSEQDSNDSIEEGSLNQPLAEQQDNLAGIFPDQITPTLQTPYHPHTVEAADSICVKSAFASGDF